ncbi:MAG: hypothetical protein ACYTG0_12930 [Planctomycetota bacterium]|jgi:hypothetical protein
MAERSRNKIHKVPGGKATDFDEQLWPIHALMFVLAGVLVALVIFRGNFEFGRTGILDNGYVQLGLVAVLIGLLTWCVVWLQSKMSRRALLCILISLLVHLSLTVYLHDHYWSLEARLRREKDQLAQERERVTVPEYVPHVPDRPSDVPSFQKPAETEAPKEPGLKPVEREPAEPDTPVDRPRPETPETPQRQQLDPAKLQRVEIPPPHRADLTAGEPISRQLLVHRPEPGEPIPLPEAQPAQRAVAPSIEAQASDVEMRPIEAPERQGETSELPADDDLPREAYQIARRSNPMDTLPERVDTSPPRRQTVPTRPIPDARVESPSPVEEVVSAQPAEPRPDLAETARRVDVPQVLRSTSRPSISPPQANLQAKARQLRFDHQPQLARRLVTVPVRRPLGQRIAIDAQVDEPPSPVVRVAPEQPSELQPAEVGVPWTPGQTPNVLARDPSRSTAITEAPASTAAAQVPSAPTRGPTPREEPSPAPVAVASLPNRLDRANRVMGLPSETQTVPAAAPEAAGGGADAGIGIAPSEARLARSLGGEVNPRSARPAAGGAEFSAGLASVSARIGQPRSLHQTTPAITSSDAPQGIPRAGPGARAGMPAPATLPDVAISGTSPAVPSGVGNPAPLEAAPDVAIQRTVFAGRAGRADAAAGAAEFGVAPSAEVVSASPARSEGEILPRLSLAGEGPAIPRAGPTAPLSPGAGPDLAMPRTAEGPSSGSPTADATDTGPSGSLQPAADALAMLPHRADVVLATGLARPDVGAVSESPGLRMTAGLGQASRTETPPGLPTAGQSPALAKHVGPTSRAGLTEQRVSEPVLPAVSEPGPETSLNPEVIAYRGPTTNGPANLTRRRLPDSPPAAVSPTAPAETSGGPRRALEADVGAGPIPIEVAGAPLRKASLAQLPEQSVDVPADPAVPEPSTASPGEGPVVPKAGVGELARSDGGLPVRIAAAPGPGGLSSNPLPVMGIPSRRARPESPIVHATPERFLLQKTSGRLTFDGRVREIPAESFQQRDPGRRADLLKQYGATEGSERAVEMGLAFLARHQFPDGHWSLDAIPGGDQPDYADVGHAQIRGDTAATGLALLSFLGAGYTHMDGKYRTVLRKGIAWLSSNQQANGQLFTAATDPQRAGRIYGHGIAAIALCEAYGMTGDPNLRERASEALRFIIDAQHPTQGGWRYTKKDGAATWRKESDTSVSGWQLMALKSAQMAGLDVPDGVMDKVGRWLDLAQAEDGSQYVYNPHAADTDDQREGRVPNLAMTAEGLLMRLYLGWGRDHPGMAAGADHLKANLPEIDPRNRRARDAYYWYYATQVMFQMQGEHWKAWNGRMRPLLEESQVQQGPLAGSWHPNRPVPDRWAHAGGRLYVTTMHLLMLEVYYRHLPLFKTLTSDDVTAGGQ